MGPSFGTNLIMHAVRFSPKDGGFVVELARRPDPVPRDDEVLLDVRFAGINPADVSQMLGRYRPSEGVPADIPGIEVAGVVTAIGAKVSLFSPGDRVFGLVDGAGLASRVAAPALLLAHIPDSLGAAEAAAVPEVYITAHDALVTKGGIQQGERVGVTGGNGGVGSAALQLALDFRCDTTGVARSANGLAFIAELGARSLPHNEFLNIQTSSLNFDAIVDLVGGDYLTSSLRHLADDGRLVLVGTSPQSVVSLDSRDLMFRRLTIVGTTLRLRPRPMKAAAVSGFARDVVPRLESGHVRPVIDSIFPADRATDAFARLREQHKQGKVLLDFSRWSNP